MSKAHRSQPVVSVLGRFWNLLVEPPAAIEESWRRRQARLLATSLLIMIVVLSVGVVVVWLVPPVQLFAGGPEVYLGLGVVAILLFAYLLNRYNYYTLAAVISVVAPETAIFATTVLGWLGASPYYGREDVNLLVFTTMPILFASMLLSSPVLIGLILVNTATMLILPTPFAHIAVVDVILGPLLFSFAISALVLLVTRQRNQLERDRRAELAKQKERYQSLFDRVPVGLYRTSPEGEILDANEALVRLLGYHERKTVLGLNAVQLFVDPRVRQRELVTLKEHGIVRGFEMRLRRLDGEIIWVQDTCRAIRDDQGALLYYEGGLEDVTKRKRAQEALRESEERFRNIFENAPIGIYRTTPDGEIVMANSTLVTMLGYDSFAELAQRDLRNRGFHTEYPRSEFKKRVEAEGRITGLESAWETKDGATLFVRENARVVHDGKGDVLYYEGTVEDITERKEMEQQLRRQERLAAVGQMAGGIAHDFRNFLTSIILYAQIPLRKPDLSPDLRKPLETVVKEAQQAADLVQQILDFSRRSMMRTELVDIVRFTREVADILQKTIPENIDVSLEISPRRCVVDADPTRIQQVLMNLALNARDAMPEGGELRITLSQMQTEPGLQPLPAMSPGEWVRLAVSDTGIGMTEEVQEHIFEPFFTTKEPGEGTGLGLAQVYGIVKQHEGYIDVETEVGGGTTFCIYLPIHETNEAALTEEPSDLPQGQGETILLAEDEEKVRTATREILQSLGYRVLTAADGREAQEITQALEIDLVITDLVMPKMGGRELIEWLKQERPGLRTIAMTGYAVEKDLRDFTVDVVHKPLDVATLARTVRRALDGTMV